MKKFVLFATMIVVALFSAKAQTPADTLIRQLANTNQEIVRINKGLAIHSAMVGIGGAVELVGGLMMFNAWKNINEHPATAESSVNSYKTGIAILSLGAGIIAASYIPMPKGIRLDERGLVIPLHK